MSDETTSEPTGGTTASAIAKKPWWKSPVPYAWVIAAIIAVVLISDRERRKGVPELPVLGQVPTFALVDQDEKPFTNARMAGRVNVVNFIFTSCPTVCPVLTSRMAGIQKKLADAPEVQLVSFSVDPYTDTPAVLKEYGTKFGADFTRWSFVTGPYKELEAAVVDGFKILMDRQAVDAGEFYDIVHGEHFLLVDRQGRIRGYYRAETPELQRLVDDARRLAAETKP